MEYKTAKTYDGWFHACEPFKENGKMYTKVVNPYSGFLKKVRLYTEAEREKMDQKYREESENNIMKFYEKEGYDYENNVTYITIGNTFAVKDKLKEAGCKYSQLLGWHTPTKIEVPQGVSIVEVKLNTILDVTTDSVSYKDSAEKTIKELIQKELAATVVDSGEWIGSIDEKIKENMVVKSIRGFEGKFGWTNIYTFTYNGNDVVWFTSTSKDIKVGDKVCVSARIKDLNEYNGVKQTVITRARLAAIEED